MNSRASVEELTKGLHESRLAARPPGFDIEGCIHSGQVGTVNEVFSLTEKEVEWAEKVISAYEEDNGAGSGAISVDGNTVDVVSIKMARNTLDLPMGVT